jgi:hypothetical protein
VITVAPKLSSAPSSQGRDQLVQLVQLSTGEPVAARESASAAVRFDRAVHGHSRTLVARAAGDRAPGFSAGQLTRTMRPDDRSLTGGACVAPGREFWFVGGSAKPGRRGWLWLVNPTDAVATVDVSLYGPNGPVEVPAGRRILVAPRDEEIVGLDALAPGLPYVAAHVVAQEGRVAAALLQREVNGRTPVGVDWVPAAIAPGRDVIVPGVLAGPGNRRLRIVVPGEADAVVRLEALSAPGTPGSPPGGTPLQVVEASAGAVTEVDITRAVEAPAAVRLRADVPVTAGVELRTGADLGYVAATVPQPGPAVLAQNHAADGLRTTLVLSAVDQPARVRLTPIAPGGVPVTLTTATTLTIKAGRTVVTPVRVEGPGRFALMVTPEEGAVVGTRYVLEGTGAGQLFTSEPLTPARVTTSVPDVVADLSAALPGPAD